MLGARSGFEARRIDASHESPELLSRVLPELRRGGVVLLPADTIYGLSCRWDSARSRERIQTLKGPGRLTLYVALVASREMAFQYAEPPGPAGQELLDTHWPGPLTAVLKARPDLVPDFCLGAEGTVAFRWPGQPFLQELVRDLGLPLVSTSANRTGEPHARSAAEAWDMFGAGIDLYVDGGPVDGLPSTLVDLTHEPPELLRIGAALPPGLDLAPSVRPGRSVLRPRRALTGEAEGRS
jgi:L-threonylcarbamoyladenylate synthase